MLVVVEEARCVANGARTQKSVVFVVLENFKRRYNKNVKKKLGSRKKPSQ